MPDDIKKKTISNISTNKKESEKARSGQLKLTKEEKDILARQMMEEIDQAVTAYQPKMAKLEQYQRLADCKVKERTFPWKNCSNICYPIIATKIRVFVARAMKIMLGIAEPIMIKPGSAEEVKNAPKAQQFLNLYIKVIGKLKRTLRRTFRKVGRTGTCILKPFWVKESELKRDIVEYSSVSDFKSDYPSAEASGLPEKVYNGLIAKIKKNGWVEFTVEYEHTEAMVKIDVIDREDFIVPEGTIDNQTCLFNAQRIRKKWYELKNMEADGIYEDVDRLLTADQIELRRNEDDKDKYNTVIPDSTEFTLYEIIRKYPAFKKRTDIPEHLRNKSVDCLFKIGVQGGTKEATNIAVYLSGEVYPYFHGRRFFIPFRIEETEDFDGQGFAEKLHDMNIEINFFHNISIDSALYAVSMPFKARKGTSAEAEFQHLSPGMILWVDHMDDISQFDIRVPNHNLDNYQSMLMRQTDLHSGISDLASGRESPQDPRAPAAKAMMLLQETNVSINDYIDCLRDSFSELSYQILELYFQYMPRNMKYPIQRDGKTFFETVTRQELRMKRAELLVTGSTAEENKYMERQEYREQVLFLMGFPEIAQNPNARRELLARSMSKYDEYGLEKILPSKEDIEKAQKKMIKEAFKEEMDDRFKQMGAGGGGGAPPQVNAADIGMGG